MTEQANKGPSEPAGGDIDVTRRMSAGEVRAVSQLGRIDRYVLLQRLGCGGFGAVYRARDEVSDLEVALKMLPSLLANNPDELDNVHDNFRLVARLRHPNIANLLHLHTVEYVDATAAGATGAVPGDRLVVMDYVPGHTLGAWRRQFVQGRVPVEQALGVIAHIAEALDYAHSQKVIHRDVKPGNVIITPAGEVRILDFGLAAQLRASMSQVSHGSGETSGTPAYMSPEQWAGRPQGPASDQYGLAVLFHEMVCGAVPFASVFETNNRMVIYSAVKRETPLALPDLSRRQNRALLRALAKDPRQRFSSCSALVAALGGSARQPHGAVAVPADSGAAPPRSSSGRRLWPAVWRKVALAVMLLLGVQTVIRHGVPRWQALQRLRQEQRQERVMAHLRKRHIGRLMSRARTACETEDYARAGDILRRVLELDPGHAAGIDLQAQVSLAVGMATVVPVRSEAEVRWQRLAAVDPGQGFGDELDRGKAMLGAAHMLFEAKEYGQALERYQQLLADCDRLLALAAERAAAGREREAAGTARARAEAADTAQEATVLLRGAVGLTESAAEAFEKGQFAQASKLWITGSAEFAKAEAHARGMLAVRMARAAFESELGVVDQDLLKTYGGAEWDRVRSTGDKAQGSATDGDWSQAAATYQEAVNLLPAATAAALAAKQRAEEQAGAPGMQDPLAAARAADAVARAETAKASGDWKGVLTFAEEALAHDADSVRAQVLQNEAKAALRPRLRIISVVDGEEITGAVLRIGDLVVEARTPTTVTLEPGKSYDVRVTLRRVREGTRYAPFETIYMAERPGLQTLRAVLVAAPLPPDLVEPEDGRYAPLTGLGVGSGDAQVGQRQAVRDLRMPVEVTTREAGVALRLVPRGLFHRRSALETGGGDGDGPTVALQSVTLSAAAYVSRCEITRGQWQRVMGEGAAAVGAAGAELPVVDVTWEQCARFCAELCALEGVPAGTYRLLTEAEWEYSCRAGTVAPYCGGDSATDLANVGVYAGNSEGAIAPVGQKQANAWGLHDMHGNAWEWCLDLPMPYAEDDVTDPVASGEGTSRVVRGGSFRSPPEEARASFRGEHPAGEARNDLGFRILRVLPREK